MPVEVILPKVDMDMETGKVAAWHIREGEKVEKGAPLFDIETDKAAMEVESPASGTLRYVSAELGTVAPIGATIAWIYLEGEADAPPPDKTNTPSPSAAIETVEPARPLQERSSQMLPTTRSAPSPTPHRGSGAVRATPAARRTAREARLALDLIRGTGPKGRIQAADVAALLEEHGGSSATPPSAQWTPESGPLFMLESGADEATPILLIHGFAADGYSWAAMEPHLPSGRRILKLELPSHGRSPRRMVRSFAELSRMIVNAVDASGVEKAHIVGHSLGGALALALADVRPRLAASLALIAPGGLGAEIDGATIDGLATASRAESLGPWLRRLTADPAFLSDEFIAAAMAARRKPDLRAAQRDLADALFPDGTQSFDLRAALNRLETPTTLIWGKSDALLPWHHALAAPGRVALHLLDGVGHIPHIEAPVVTGEILRRHIGGAGG